MLRLLNCLLLALLVVSACQPKPAPGPTLSISESSFPTQSTQLDPTITSIPFSPTPPESDPIASTTIVALSPSPTVTLPPSPTSPAITTLLFTGIIVPARCVQAAIDASGDPDYLYDGVREIISQADLAVGTLNATMSDYSPHTGCVPTYVLVGGSENADALARAGFDMMSVATNHIKNCGLTNCGDRAFFDTLENLRRVGILPVGAGANHAEAIQPVVVTINGVRFGFISLGQIEPMAFAGEDTPGIAVLNEENLEAAIEAARQVSDVVIVLPHWGPEEVSWPGYIQRGLAKQAVASGADLVVGNHTHVVQAVQEIDGVQVFYGLGNFVFDQWEHDHQQGVILLVKFEGTQYKGYEFIPTHVNQDGRVFIADPQEAAEILGRIEQAGQGLK